MPDEAFRRLRGALFFGPAFRVTRNKLLFRDNLQELLATAVPGAFAEGPRLEDSTVDRRASEHVVISRNDGFYTPQIF